MTEVEQSQRVCPLCGGDNRCAMAAGEPPESCWCQTVTISAQALSAVPADALGRRCLCPSCARISEVTTSAR